MRRPRVFLPSAAQPGDVLALPPEASRHLRTVLRLGPGDRVEGVAPDGTLLEMELAAGGGARVVAAAPPAAHGGAPVAEPAVAVTLALAVPGGPRMDWVVEKATELGVAAILPLRAERSPRGEAGPGRHERWRRLARAAAEQSRRQRIPEILPPAPLSAAVAGVAGVGGPCLLADPRAPLGVAQAVGAWPPGTERALVAVGPEGGWTGAELESARAAAAVTCSLGPRILRVETAALVALTLVLGGIGALDPARA